MSLAGGAPSESRESTHIAVAPWFWPVAIAALIRIPVAFYAEDQWGDAPIRLDLLQRWMAAPGIWWSFRETFQYGPLPTHVAGLLGLAGLGDMGAARTLVAVCGIAACGLLASLAARVGGPRAGLAAGLALAISPLHIQTSTTFASEAIYLAAALATLWAAWERRPFLCMLFAFCASTTRYDAWLWLPILALWWLTRRDETPSRRWVTAVSLGTGPASIVIANGLALGNPLRPLEYINGDHLALVARSQALFGVLPWRAMMVVYWPAALIGALTPAFGVAITWGAWRTIRSRPPALLPVVIGAIVPAVYSFRTIVLGTLWPMARFALGPVAFLAIAMPPLRARALAACLAVGLALDASTIALGDGKPGIGLAAAAMSPVSRLPADLRAGGQALRAVPGPVALDFSPTYEDILIAYEARMYRYRLLHPKGAAPRRVVTIAGGAWNAQLEATSRLFGHSYQRTGGVGRVSWWDLVK
jgi:hypothetical protein